MTIDVKLIDQLLTDYKKPEDIIGENGLLKQLTKAILERALTAEMNGTRNCILRQQSNRLADRPVARSSRVGLSGRCSHVPDLGQRTN